MKSFLAPAFLMTAFLFAGGTAQLQSEEWLSEVSVDSVIDDFDGKEDAGKCADDCNRCCGPTWTFAAAAVFMQRSHPDSLVLMEDALDPTRNLNADALGFDFTAGWDVSVQREMGNGGLEARLFSIDGWDSAASAISGPAALVQINNAIPFFAPGVSLVNATYNSELLSAELNLRRQVSDRVSLLGGFRYIELDEHFHAALNRVALLPTTYDTLTRNRMYGGQLGADATLWCRDRLTIEGLAKAGVFHNSGGQNTVYDSGLVVVTATDTSDRAAFLGELAFTANYCLSDSLTLRGGYNMLWLETVALATDQIPATNFGTSSGINADGGAFYHGAFVGLEYRR